MPDLQPAPEIQAKIAALESELDEIWPGWRRKERFDHLPTDYMARLKWCLKRHALLTFRDPKSGIPLPRDWAVKIVAPTNKSGKMVYAHPIIPDAGGVEPDQKYFAGPPKVGTVAVSQAISAPELAMRIRVPLETVEDLLPLVPADEDAGRWIKAQVVKSKRAAKRRAEAAAKS